MRSTMAVYHCKPEDLKTTSAAFIRPVQELLELNCDRGLEAFVSPRLLICVVRTAEGLHIVQDRAWGGVQPVVFQAADSSFLSVMPDKSVDSVFLSTHLDESAEPGSAFRARLNECERVARQQLVVYGPQPVPEDQLVQAGFTLVLSEETQSDRGAEAPPHRTAFYAIKDLPAPDWRDLRLKVAVISPVFPPNNAGQAMVLERLFRPVNPAHYCLISSRDYSSVRFPRLLTPGTNDILPGKFVYLPAPKRGLGAADARRPGGPGIVRFLAAIYVRARQIARVLRQERCEAVLGCSGDLVDFPASFLASRFTGVPFYAYVFDYYGYQALVPSQQRLAQIVERRVLKRAARVLVLNEFLAEEYRQRYAIDPLIIYNPSDIEEPPSSQPWPRCDDEIRILFTGQIYEAQYDALYNLVQAIGILNDPRIKLHLYTAQPTDLIRRQGIDGPVVFHSHRPQAAIRALQREADILFLPLAFRSPYPEIIRTSSPSKTGEYLASGRPVLVHAPAGSYLTWYFRQHQCGLVIDEPNPQALAVGLRRILDDAGLRRTLIGNAWQRAQADFDTKVARSKLFAALQP